MAESNSTLRPNTPEGSTVLRHKLSRDQFVMLTNKVARDSRLSFRARGVLLEMISRPPNWKFSAERLAKGSPKEGREAVQTALRELETAGYLLRYRERLANGRFRTVVMVSDLPVEDWKQSAERVSDALSDGVPDGVGEGVSEPSNSEFSQFGPETGEPTSVDPSPIEERGKEEPTDLTCLQLASLAGDAQNFEPEWREIDRQLFAEIIDADVLKTDGTKWSQGTFTVDAVYTGYRKIRGKKWPGRWLRSIEEAGQFEDWLIDEGLTVVEHAAR